MKHPHFYECPHRGGLAEVASQQVSGFGHRLWRRTDHTIPATVFTPSSGLSVPSGLLRPDVPNLRSGGRYRFRSIKTFLYLHCDMPDLDRARHFYSGILGLPEIFFSADEGTAGYQAGDLQITVEAHSGGTRTSGWSKQLGWSGGSTAAPSWGVELPPTAFAQAISAALASDVECWLAEPQWVGYWSFPVRDPMGNTVELSAPEQSAWEPVQP